MDAVNVLLDTCKSHDLSNGEKDTLISASVILLKVRLKQTASELDRVLSSIMGAGEK